MSYFPPIDIKCPDGWSMCATSNCFLVGFDLEEKDGKIIAVKMQFEKDMTKWDQIYDGKITTFRENSSENKYILNGFVSWKSFISQLSNS